MKILRTISAQVVYTAVTSDYDVTLFATPNALARDYVGYYLEEERDRSSEAKPLNAEELLQLLKDNISIRLYEEDSESWIKIQKHTYKVK